MTIIINDKIKCIIDKNILIKYSDYFKSLFSNKYIENKHNICYITIDTIKSTNQWLSIEYIINSFNNKHINIEEYNEDNKKFLYNSNYIKSNIYTLNYIQATDIIHFYLSNLKKYLLESYDIIIDYGLLFLNIFECCDIFNLKNLNDIENIKTIFYKNLLDENYINLKHNILESNLDINIKSILLYIWSIRFKDFEYITNTDFQYFNINNIRNTHLYEITNNFIKNENEFWNIVKNKTNIWHDLIRYNLPDKVIVSGGFIPSCINNLIIEKYNDIDIWMLKGGDLYKLINIIKNYLKDKNINNTYIVIKKSLITIHIENEIPLQIILTDFNTAQQLLSNFDFDYLCSYISNQGLFLSCVSLYTYITRTTRFICPKYLINIDRGIKAIKKGFIITDDIYGFEKNILHDSNDIYDTPIWNDTKNKYIEYSNSICRNNYLLKKIYNADDVENDFDDIWCKYNFESLVISDYKNINNVISIEHQYTYKNNFVLNNIYHKIINNQLIFNFNNFILETMPIAINKNIIIDNYKTTVSNIDIDSLNNYQTKIINYLKYILINKINNLYNYEFENLNFNNIDLMNAINHNNINLDFINSFNMINFKNYNLHIKDKNNFKNYIYYNFILNQPNIYIKIRYKIKNILFQYINDNNCSYIVNTECIMITIFDNEYFNDFNNFINLKYS